MSKNEDCYNVDWAGILKDIEVRYRKTLERLAKSEKDEKQVDKS